MINEVKSGKEILDVFFENIENIPEVNMEIAGLLKDLYKKGKLSDKNIYNALLKQREGQEDGKN